MNEIQKKVLYETLSGLANRYGVLPLSGRLDFKHFHPLLEGVPINQIQEMANQAQGPDFIVRDGVLFSRLYNEAQYTDLFFYCYEFPLPAGLSSKDATGWSDVRNLPVTPELDTLKAYCLSKTPRSDNKEELGKQFLMRFYVSFNGITVREHAYVLPGILNFFEIEDDDELDRLFEAAAQVQPSWYNGGLRAVDRKKDQWLDAGLADGRLTLRCIDRVNSFIVAAMQLYGFIEKSHAYRIYKKFEDNEAVSREDFDLIANHIDASVVCPFSSDAYVSGEFNGISADRYWSQSFMDNLQKDKTADKHYLSLYWMLYQRQQGAHRYAVPSKAEFYRYADFSYIPENRYVEALRSLLDIPSDRLLQMNFNLKFKQLSHAYGDDAERFVSDFVSMFGLEHATDDKIRKAIRLFSQALDELPAWENAGLPLAGGNPDGRPSFRIG